MKSKSNNDSKGKERWAILRNAILHNNSSSNHPKSSKNTTTKNIINPVSIHAFQGFSLLSKQKITFECETETNNVSTTTTSSESNIIDKKKNIYLDTLCTIPIDITLSSTITCTETFMKQVKNEINKCVDSVSCLFDDETSIATIAKTQETIIQLRIPSSNAESNTHASGHDENKSIRNERIQNIISQLKVCYNVTIPETNSSEFQIKPSANGESILLFDIPISLPSNPPKRNNTEYDCYEYTIPVQNNTTSQLRMRTRERSISKRSERIISLKDLVSQEYNDGVDNTGNICLWDSAITLTYLLFQEDSLLPYNFNSMYSSVVEQHRRDSSASSFRVIELGAGMAALPSLALSTIQKEIPIHLTITDGHSNSILNNKVCHHLTNTLQPHATDPTRNRVKYHQLKWDKSIKGYTACQSLLTNTTAEGYGYHLCLVSDCLHFTEYHMDLLYTISRLLCVNGICILCQPKRGLSMTIFLELLQNLRSGNQKSDLLYDVTVLEEGYEDRITALHRQFLEAGVGSESYCPDVHYPTVIILKKLHEWKECV